MSLKDQVAKEREAEAMRARHQKSLPARARRFCLNVFRGMTDVEAALKAGFPESCAKQKAVELRNDGRILLLIKELEDKGRDDDGEEITAEYVLRRLRRIADNSELRG